MFKLESDGIVGADGFKRLEQAFNIYFNIDEALWVPRNKTRLAKDAVMRDLASVMDASVGNGVGKRE